jgi:hypothetical protein
MFIIIWVLFLRVLFFFSDRTSALDIFHQSHSNPRLSPSK